MPPLYDLIRIALAMLLLTSCAAPREVRVSDELREAREAEARVNAWIAGYAAGMDEGRRVFRCRQPPDIRPRVDWGAP